MSDSSEDEDLSRFREAVDNSFVNNLKNVVNDGAVEDSTPKTKPKSERYLEDASHYNDVKVPEEMQKKIGAKLSALIEKKIKFIDVDMSDDKQSDIKGGIKLFKDSKVFLSSEEISDSHIAALHNAESKKVKRKRRNVDNDDEVSKNDKITSVAVSGDYVLSKEETKCWKSRRKEKLYKYKKSDKGVLLSLE